MSGWQNNRFFFSDENVLSLWCIRLGEEKFIYAKIKQAYWFEDFSSSPSLPGWGYHSASLNCMKNAWISVLCHTKRQRCCYIPLLFTFCPQKQKTATNDYCTKNLPYFYVPGMPWCWQAWQIWIADSASLLPSFDFVPQTVLSEQLRPPTLRNLI